MGQEKEPNSTNIDSCHIYFYITRKNKLIFISVINYNLEQKTHQNLKSLLLVQRKINN